MLKFSIKDMSLTVFLILTFSRISFALNASPVLILDDGVLDGVVATQTNPLVMTRPEEFESAVDLAQKRGQCLVFFIEDEFAFEDISSKDEKGTPYFHLRRKFLDKRVKLLPRVFEPYNYLKNRFQPFDFNTFHVRRTTTKLRLEENYKFLYIFFEDGTNETRTQKLRRHDVIIEEVIFAVTQMTKGPVIAFYTGKYNPVDTETDARKVKPRINQPTPTNPGKFLAAVCDNASFEFIDPVMRHAGDKISFFKVNKCDRVSDGKGGWTYSIAFEDLGQEDSTYSPFYELIFSFTFAETRNQHAGWKLNRITYVSQRKGVLKTKWFDYTGEWDDFFESPLPLVMQPNLGLGMQSITNYSNIPTLEMKNFRMYLSSSERLMPPPGDPTRTTTLSTTKLSTTKTQIFRVEDNKDIARGFKEMVDTIIHLWVPDGLGAAPLSNLHLPLAAEKYVDIVILDCLIIVFILISVLLFAVKMLMSIRTNSNYDSPDQPPLFTADIGE